MDRLSVREPPSGPPLIYQTWRDLLFLHWPLPLAAVRPLVPPELEIDTREGRAWVTLAPFAVKGMRAPLLPALPLLSRSLQLNARTYVFRDGVPGVWFLSLEASNPLAVLGARLGFGIPYYQARMRMEAREGRVSFFSKRMHSDAPRAQFEAGWTLGEELPRPRPDSPEFFLVERYVLYTRRADRLYRARLHHRPWTLRRASLLSLSSNVLEANGLPTPEGEPLVHALSGELRAAIWPPKEV